MSEFDEMLDAEPMTVRMYRILKHMADRIRGLSLQDNIKDSRITALEGRLTEAVKPAPVDRADDSILPAVKCCACQQWVNVHQSSRARINNHPVDLCHKCREALQISKPAPETTTICPTCKGEGWVEYRDDDDAHGPIMCQACRGSGKVTPAPGPTSGNLYVQNIIDTTMAPTFHFQREFSYCPATPAQVRAEYERLFPDEAERAKVAEAFLHAALIHTDMEIASARLNRAAAALDTLTVSDNLRAMAAVLEAAAKGEG